MRQLGGEFFVGRSRTWREGKRKGERETEKSGEGGHLYYSNFKQSKGSVCYGMLFRIKEKGDEVHMGLLRKEVEKEQEKVEMM